MGLAAHSFGPNAWRWNYQRCAGRALELPSKPKREPRSLRLQLLQNAREQQADNVRRTGFVQQPEIGNALVLELRKRRCPRAFIPWGAHVAAVSSEYNWQGNPRLAELCGYSLRTAQRARRWFEDRGLIRSELLEPGDRLPKQRHAVRRPMIARFVGELQKLSREGASYQPPWRRRKPSAAEVSHTAETTRSPDAVEPSIMIAFHVELAADARRRDPEPTPSEPSEPSEAPTPSEIDEWDRETAELERRERGPPIHS